MCSIDSVRTHLPRDRKLLVDSLRAEEPKDIFLETLLEIFLEDDIFPVGLLNINPKSSVLRPKALVEDPDLIVELLAPKACAKDEGTGWFLRTFQSINIFVGPQHPRKRPNLHAEGRSGSYERTLW